MTMYLVTFMNGTRLVIDNDLLMYHGKRREPFGILYWLQKQFWGMEWETIEKVS